MPGFKVLNRDELEQRIEDIVEQSLQPAFREMLDELIARIEKSSNPKPKNIGWLGGDRGELDVYVICKKYQIQTRIDYSKRTVKLLNLIKIFHQ